MIEPRTNPVHLYRALLRECTYLPDPRAKTYFHDHVVFSFRQYLPKTKSCRAEIPFERQVRLLDRGRKGLSMLRRANEGYLKPLERVLMITYGRMGKRRRQLLSQLLLETPPVSNRELGTAPKIAAYNKGWEPPDIIKTLIRSQAARRGVLDRLIRRVRPKPVIPEKNIWGKEMPVKRVRNALKKWYVRNLDLILPPLPENEWLELQRKAQGKAPWSGPPKRRLAATTFSEAEDHIAKPEVLLDGPAKAPSFAMYVDSRPHHITLRLMRHLWTVVLRHTPLLVWDNVGERFVVRWDDVPKRPQRISAPDDGTAALLFGDWPANLSSEETLEE